MTCVRAATTEEWREAHAASPNATFFHGPLWASIWERYTGGVLRAAPLHVELEDGLTAVVGATSAPTRIAGVRRTLLSPAGNCGGWVSGDRLTQAHAEALTEAVLHLAPLLWHRHALDRPAADVPVAGAVEEFTHLVDLRDGADAAIRRWRKRARQAARYAEEAGVTVRRARGLDDWLAYYRVYLEVARQWDEPSSFYDESLFTLLAGLDDPAVGLRVAELRGKVVGGSVDLRHRGHVVAWHAATDRSAATGIAQLLDREAIRTYCAQGLDWYDLNGSGPHPGVAHYKDGVGGARVPVWAVERRHPVERAGRRVRDLLALAR